MQNIQNMGGQNMGMQNMGMQNMGGQNMGGQNMGMQNMGMQGMGMQNQMMGIGATQPPTNSIESSPSLALHFSMLKTHHYPKQMIELHLKPASIDLDA
jgi:hypothetical protein